MGMYIHASCVHWGGGGVGWFVTSLYTLFPLGEVIIIIWYCSLHICTLIVPLLMRLGMGKHGSSLELNLIHILRPCHLS